MSTIADKSRELTRLFQSVTDTPALDAEMLIAHVTRKTKTQLIVESSAVLSRGELAILDEFAKQRSDGKPIAYLTGTKAFWTMDLKVTQDTLIPRPDTECLVQWILDRFPANKKIKIADLGTGSGAIAIALASERPNWIIYATDQSVDALAIAKCNAKKYSTDIHFYHGNWCDALPDTDYDLIVSNPPYIAENDAHLSALKHEPISALTAKDNGLADIKTIITQAKKHLNSKGTLVIEHGYNQQEDVLSLFNSTVFSAKGFKDLAGQPRFITAQKRVGILLINLGTPDAPDTQSVRRYLKAFLLDPYVVSLPAILRYALVYGLILPFRPKQSAHAYQQIWTKNGSPLLTNSCELKKALSEQCGDAFRVALGMRYGNPSIQSAVSALNQTCEHVIVLPLFPQYAKATTQSAIDAFLRCNFHGSYDIVSQFYDHPAFIKSQAQLLQQTLDQASWDFVLFSYHGLPEKQLKDEPKPNYRDQCYATTKAIADQLNLSENKYQTAFQSRLGRTKWIEPYTEETIIALRKQGVKNLVVICPSFISDCLETLEEIGIRLKEQWQTLGGNAFTLTPCLNEETQWIKGLLNTHYVYSSDF